MGALHHLFYHLHLENAGLIEAFPTHRAQVGLPPRVDQAVSLQVHQVAETPPAQLTLVRFQAGVNDLVGFQRPFGDEAFLAPVAPERPLQRVDPLVDREVAGLGEVLPTDTAAERLLPRVRPPVDQQAVSGGEALAADVAVERLDVRVNKPVGLQRLLPAKLLPADLAGVRSDVAAVFLVCQQVLIQGGLVDKRLITHAAAERPFSCVDALVVSKQRHEAETLGALVTTVATPLPGKDVFLDSFALSFLLFLTGLWFSRGFGF